MNAHHLPRIATAFVRNTFLVVLTTTTSLLAFAAQVQQVQYQQLRSFGNTNLMGGGPFYLIQASDGVLYGTGAGAPQGAGIGVIFKLSTNGNQYAVLHVFGLDPGDGYGPNDLIGCTDGAIYGVTGAGGSANNGTIYRIDRNGGNYRIVYNMVTNGSPVGLIEGTNGVLYGVSSAGPAGAGTVFSLSKEGGGFKTLHSFSPNQGPDGQVPFASVIQGKDGYLYGTTWQGGPTGNGTVFKIRTDGSGFSTIWAFGGTNGAAPYGRLVESSDGFLYGTTGDASYGGVFRINKDGSNFQNFPYLGFDFSVWDRGDGLVEGADGLLYGQSQAINGCLYRFNRTNFTYSLVHRFKGFAADGDHPLKVVVGKDGALYGTTVWGGACDEGSVYRVLTDGTGYGLVWNFSESGGDGRSPWSAPSQLRDGSLIGCTARGGQFDCGAVYRMNNDGTGYQVLHSFDQVHDASEPFSRLIEASDGLVYGTAFYGSNYVTLVGNGIIFRIDPAGTNFQVIYRFSQYFINGANPRAGVIEGGDGFLYGVAETGGTTPSLGTIFKVEKTGGNFQVLHYFAGQRYPTYLDGESPFAPLIEVGGKLYGVADGAGGIVYSINKDGTGYIILHKFQFNNPQDGGNPNVPLVAHLDGRLYGATAYGGGYYNRGTIYGMNKDGSGYAVIHTNVVDYPIENLLAGPDGFLYGVAQHGANGYGVVFKVRTDGSGYTNLYSFTGADGIAPVDLAAGSDGQVYGATTAGGLGLGVLFSIAAPKPFLSLSLTNTGARLTFAHTPGGTYALERSPDLKTWATISSGVFPWLEFVSFLDTNQPSPVGFYRVKLQ